KAPEMYTYEVINEYPHDPEAFTQGLEFYNGYLYESTGQNGFSSLRKVDLTSGKVLQKADLDKQYFGEGMTIFGDKIYMLTWQSGKGFIFDRDSFKQVGEFKYNQSKEGWGLTHNAKQLIKSDGSDHIWFLDPGTLQEVSSIETFTNKRRAEKLNELEYINGKIYANIWQQNGIIIVNPENGAIEGIADLSGLQSRAGQSGENYVLNGIAYDKEHDRLFVTGKEWNKVFEIKLKPKQ
ncbi:MAG: glutaminyl-peptide cyclotransferase, partial [Flavobacteriaceae bacterium]|nr:glutaminyl-peptide cyclotransferase [Flavobacteriaceae bacterium]